jgi:hypothetical protein
LVELEKPASFYDEIEHPINLFCVRLTERANATMLAKVIATYSSNKATVDPQVRVS